MLTMTHLQRFSVHDGPGIRTTVFCKGCSLRCFWCHNPEAIEPAVRLWHSKEQCIACGSCRDACLKGLFPVEECILSAGKTEDGCVQGTYFPCVIACPTGALSHTGRRIEQDTLIERLLSDVSHYRRTGGGITFSGGEPLLQALELKKIMADERLLGISKAIDTAGNVGWEKFSQVLPWTDLFLYDIKSMNSMRHKEGTGAENGRIQENLERLCRTGRRIWIRVPVIPGWNDSEQEIKAIAQRLQELSALPGCGMERIQLLPFHRFGEEKYLRLGWEYPARELAPPSEEKMESLLKIFREMGLQKAEIGNHPVFVD